MANRTTKKYLARKRRHRRVRAKIFGTASTPRLNVYRSSEHIYAQLIDDEASHTLTSASTIDPEIKSRVAGKTKSEAAKIVGEVIAERAKAAGVTSVVFDRGGWRYQGRVKALAEGARAGGLKF